MIKKSTTRIVVKKICQRSISSQGKPFHLHTKLNQPYYKFVYETVTSLQQKAQYGICSIPHR